MIESQTVKNLQFCHGHVLYFVYHFYNALLELFILHLLIYLVFGKSFALVNRKDINFVQKFDSHGVLVGNLVNFAHELDGRHFHLIASLNQWNVIASINFFAIGFHCFKVLNID